MLKIAVLVSGGGTNLQAIIDAAACGKIKNTGITLVISNKPGAYALERAAKSNIPAVCISPKDYADKDAYDTAMIEALTKAGAELVVLAGFLVVLSSRFVNAYEGKIINIHPSLIPAFCGDGYYGLKVHEKVLERGVKVTGATVHFVDDGTDTGPIIMQKAVSVEQDDTPEVLQKRVMEQAEWEILPLAIHKIANHELVLENGKVRYLK